MFHGKIKNSKMSNHVAGGSIGEWRRESTVQALQKSPGKVNDTLHALSAEVTGNLPRFILHL